MSADYHSDPAIGSTALRDLSRSPAHYHAIHVARTAPRTETPAMKRGTAVHCCVLEPERWATDYIVEPRFDKRTNVGKAAEAEFKAANADRVTLSADDYATAEAISASVRRHPGAAALLRMKAGTEVPIHWEDETTGVKCKGKIDLVARTQAGVILVDLKTTTDASPRGFERAIANWALHSQAAHYIDGWRTVTGETPAAYVLIAVESEAPYAVATYALDQAAIDRGAADRLRALDTLCECLRTGAWPAYSSEIVTISLPRWAA